MRRAAIPLLLALAAVILWQWRAETARNADPGAVVASPRSAPATDGSTPAKAPATQAVAPVPADAAPSFDVVRVEPDGSALVAGRAEPDAPVEVLSGGEVVARTRANASGEFVTDFALPVGEHRLSLGETGGETAIVSVPVLPARDDLLVLAQRPGEASRVLALPAPAAPEASVPPAAEGRAPLAVEAVEIEGRQIFVAGAAPKGATVRVYIDDRPVTETTGGAGDRFVASATVDVAPGDRRVRADQIRRDGGVEARVEVPFERPEGERMAAVAAAAASGEGAAPLEPSDARVIIRRGDTLWRISRDLYGRGARYTVIYLANGDQIRDPNRIYPGQVFRTPADDPAAPG